MQEYTSALTHAKKAQQITINTSEDDADSISLSTALMCRAGIALKDWPLVGEQFEMMSNEIDARPNISVHDDVAGEIAFCVESLARIEDDLDARRLAVFCIGLMIELNLRSKDAATGGHNAAEAAALHPFSNWQLASHAIHICVQEHARLSKEKKSSATSEKKTNESKQDGEGDVAMSTELTSDEWMRAVESTVVRHFRMLIDIAKSPESPSISADEITSSDNNMQQNASD